MMMAFDSTGGPSLDDETLAALRDALARYAGDGDHSADMRDVLRRTALEAREKGILPERLLVVLKDIWHSLVEHRHTLRADDQRRRLQQLVTWCINAYYEE